MARRSLLPLLLSLFVACGGSTEDDPVGSVASSAGGTAGAGLSGSSGQGAAAGSTSAGGQGGSAAAGGAASGQGGSGAGKGGAGPGGAGGGGQGGSGGSGGSSGKGGSGGGGQGGSAGQGGKAQAGSTSAGSGGSGGSGGSAGAGGSGGVAVGACGGELACGAPSCGNGVRDSCQVCSGEFGGGFVGGDPPPPPPPEGPMGAGGGACAEVTETCDGKDLGGQSCASLGWSSGTLACSPGCSIDTSGCASCLPAGGALAACGVAPLGAVGATSVALATHGADLAVAWSDASGISVATLDGSLKVVKKSGSLGEPAASVALTALAGGGWLLASSLSGEIELIRLDAQLGLMSQTKRSGYGPLLGQREQGPLLMYASNTAIVVEVLDGTGALAAGPTKLTENIEPEYGNAVFDGSVFWVGQRGYDGAQVFRVSTDAKVLSSAQLGSSETEYPQVAIDGANVRATFNDFGVTKPSVNLVSLDSSGKPSGPPTLIGSAPEQFNVAPLVLRGATSLVLLGGYTGETGVGQSLDLRSSAGASAPIARGPHLSHYGLVKLPSELVVAWVAHRYCGGSIELARLSL